jgi:type VI secretion system secreted protein Hcp
VEETNMKKRARVLVLVCIAVLTMLPTPASAAANASLQITGDQQGQIRGSSTRSGRQNTIDVASVRHEVTSPRDAASGLPTGKRTHKPLVITKKIDKSTPLLLSALVNNENLSSFVLSVYASSKKGTETVAYRIRLTNANIASIRLVTDDNGELAEEISFTYQKIEWTWVDGAVQAEDDWERPVAKKALPRSPLGR